MKIIQLTQGKQTVVDDEDFELLSKYKWCAINGAADKNRFYACTSVRTDGKSKNVLMHRMIMNATKGLTVDHKNRDSLDNTRSNLRFATKSQQMMNRKMFYNNSLGVKGVYRKRRCFGVDIRVNGKKMWVGSFKTLEEAKEAYNAAALKYYGEFACLNE